MAETNCSQGENTNWFHEKLSFTMFVCLFHQKHLVPMGGVMSQLRDVKMKLDTVQHLESKKDLLQDVEDITRFVVFR